MTKAHHNFGWGIVLADIVLVLLTCNGEVRAAAQTLASISKKGIENIVGDGHDIRRPATAGGVLPGQSAASQGKGTGILGTGGSSRNAARDY